MNFLGYLQASDITKNAAVNFHTHTVFPTGTCISYEEDKLWGEFLGKIVGAFLVCTCCQITFHDALC